MNRLLACAAALAVALFSASSFALGPPGTGYWGVSAGKASFGGADVMAGRAYGGYTLSPWLSLEGGVLGTNTDRDGAHERELRAIAASATGLLTLSNRTWVTPFVKGGLHYTDVGCTDLDASQACTGEGGYSESDIGLVYGAGVAYRLFDADAPENHPKRGGHWSFRADWEAYDVDPKLSAITAAIQYSFF